jgi:DNA-3-methyladenine glycosylase II
MFSVYAYVYGEPMSKKKSAHGNLTSINVVKPYDFILTLRASRSFEPTPLSRDDQLHLATRIIETPTLIEVTQGLEGKIKASAIPECDNSHLHRIVEWVLFAELDLTPFYCLAGKDPNLTSIIKRLHGLKPMRPISLFEMAVVAITEQQISLAAAYRIRSRIIQRFGEPIGNQWIFPEPQILANAPIEDLRSCGLSRQKTQYTHELAKNIIDGALDLDTFKTMNDDEARETIMSLRGFGRWSADYILVRGLARPDCVPVDDLAVRSVVGEYLGEGRRASSLEVSEILEPFRPYRGLLAFYLLAEHRLNPAQSTKLFN